MGEELLKLERVKKYFPIKDGIFKQKVRFLKAVDDVSFTVYKGETVSIVGESGCGKSTLARTIVRLEEPTAGNIYFEGQNLRLLRKKEMRKKRKELQIIFQDPHHSLNPRQRIRNVLYEAMVIQKTVPKRERWKRTEELLQKVGIHVDKADSYPHELSGGEKQRIAIARALAVQAKIIICDEIVSSLDVALQTQILRLLKRLQKEFQLTYLFISHDLNVVSHISDRVIVMYLGQIVEMSDTESLFNHARHPYTKALLSAIPIPHPGIKRNRMILTGEVPSPIHPPSGCRFHPRCPFVSEKCRKITPTLRNINELETNHQVACHYFDKVTL